MSDASRLAPRAMARTHRGRGQTSARRSRLAGGQSADLLLVAPTDALVQDSKLRQQRRLHTYVRLVLRDRATRRRCARAAVLRVRFADLAGRPAPSWSRRALCLGQTGRSDRTPARGAGSTVDPGSAARGHSSFVAVLSVRSRGCSPASAIAAWTTFQELGSIVTVNATGSRPTHSSARPRLKDHSRHDHRAGHDAVVELRFRLAHAGRRSCGPGSSNKQPHRHRREAQIELPRVAVPPSQHAIPRGSRGKSRLRGQNRMRTARRRRRKPGTECGRRSATFSGLAVPACRRAVRADGPTADDLRRHHMEAAEARRSR